MVSRNDGFFYVVRDLLIALSRPRRLRRLADPAGIQAPLADALRGGLAGAGLCYGYDVVRCNDAAGQPMRRERSINEAEAKIVRRIFHDFAAGKSPRAIALKLNRVGGARTFGNSWGDTTIRGHASIAGGLPVSPRHWPLIKRAIRLSLPLPPNRRLVLTPGERRGGVHSALRGELMAILDIAGGGSTRGTAAPGVITNEVASPRPSDNPKRSRPSKVARALDRQGGLYHD